MGTFCLTLNLLKLLSADWKMALDTWYLTPDTWHMTPENWRQKQNEKLVQKWHQMRHEMWHQKLNLKLHQMWHQKIVGWSLTESSFLTSEEFGQGKYYEVLMMRKTAKSICTLLPLGQFHKCLKQRWGWGGRGAGGGGPRGWGTNQHMDNTNARLRQCSQFTIYRHTC